MDLSKASQAAESTVPVGIGAQQFLEWLEMEPNGSASPKVHLSAAPTGMISWSGLLRTPGGFIVLGAVAWVVACLAYAVTSGPDTLMAPPDQVYQQIQEQIRQIPLPWSSPHYTHHRKYYLEQYQQYLRSYREMQSGLPESRSLVFNAAVFMQGLCLGTWLLIVALAACEYQYGTLSLWIEVLGEWWDVLVERLTSLRTSWGARRAVPDDAILADEVVAAAPRKPSDASVKAASGGGGGGKPSAGGARLQGSVPRQKRKMSAKGVLSHGVAPLLEAGTRSQAGEELTAKKEELQSGSTMFFVGKRQARVGDAQGKEEQERKLDKEEEEEEKDVESEHDAQPMEEANEEEDEQEQEQDREEEEEDEEEEEEQEEDDDERKEDEVEEEKDDDEEEELEELEEEAKQRDAKKERSNEQERSEEQEKQEKEHEREISSEKSQDCKDWETNQRACKAEADTKEAHNITHLDLKAGKRSRSTAGARRNGGRVKASAVNGFYQDALNGAVVATGATSISSQNFLWGAEIGCSSSSTAAAVSEASTASSGTSSDPSSAQSDGGDGQDSSSAASCSKDLDTAPHGTPDHHVEDCLAKPLSVQYETVACPPGLEQRNFLAEMPALSIQSPPGLEHVYSSFPGLGAGIDASGETNFSSPVHGSSSPTENSSFEGLLSGDLDGLSTDELISLLFDHDIREGLARRGVALRKHLLRCLRLLQSPGPTALGQPDTDTSSVDSRAGKDLRADAPEFTPLVPEVSVPQTGWFLLSTLDPLHGEQVAGDLVHGKGGASGIEPEPPPMGDLQSLGHSEEPDPELRWRHECRLHKLATASALRHAARLRINNTD